MTNQTKQHELRESQRLRLEKAREAERNTARVKHSKGIVMLTATDHANRIVHVELDDFAIDSLIAELLECRNQLSEHSDDCPATRRDGQ
jgi:hypothetical protein